MTVITGVFKFPLTNPLVLFHKKTHKMVNTVSSGVLRGQPVGGVVTLLKKSLMPYITTIASNDRYVIIKVADWIFVNLVLAQTIDGQSALIL